MPNTPPLWIQRLRADREAGVPLKRLRKRYSVTQEAIERLYKLYGWEWTDVTVVVTEQQKGRIRLPGQARRVPGAASTSVQLSERLKGAWLQYGIDGLREGLAALEADIGLVAVENIGAEESAMPVKINITRSDLLRIDVLDSRSIRHHKRTPSRSLIVRQALEHIIVLRDNQEFAKPPDWVSRPLDVAQGGQSAWSLGGVVKMKSFSIPLYLYSRVEGFRTQRGTTAHDPEKPNLSRWVRDAIDSVTMQDDLKALVPLPARKLRGYTSSGTIPLVLPGGQIDKMKSIQAAVGCNQSEAIAVAVASSLGWKPDESVWLVWRAVATSGLEEVAERLGLEADVIAEQLIAAGYLKRSKPTASRHGRVEMAIEPVAEEAKTDDATDTSDAI